jgi:single-stranded-DNA-specific exonuclease
LWKVPPALPASVDTLIPDYPAAINHILYNRGFQTFQDAWDFLNPHTPPGADPFGFLGMSAAVDRVRSAIRRHEPIAVYGDYDVDGVTATALLTEALRSFGADVEGYIPNRFDEGYGLNFDALDSLKERGVKLVITVDCGIRSIPEVDHARHIGLDMIITDHHHPAEEMPIALAVINPKQPGCPYPDKNLAGVGLAYKLALAVADRSELPGLLDLVALGTVADMVPLKGENRSLVRAGMQAIRTTTRPGLISLINITNLKQPSINSTDIGFMLGPRLNAAGRLESAMAALHLLTNTGSEPVAVLAQALDNQNRERQTLTRRIQEDAEQKALANDPDSPILIAVDPGYNPGVVGLAAGRLVDLYYRPAVVAHQGDEFTRASCRSIPEFHITDALDECADLLEHHGGHAAAAGFTIRNDRLPELIQRLQAVASRVLDGCLLQPEARTDLEIRLSDLHPELLGYIEMIQPFGQGNPQVTFVSRNLTVTRFRPVGMEEAHLKLSVSDGKITYNAIAFRMGHWAKNMPRRIDLLYAFETNEYNGQTELQLNVKDLKPASE